MAPRWLAVYGLAIASLIALAATNRPKVGWIDVAALVFLGWAALSLTWSGDWRAGVGQFQNLAALFAIAFAVRHIRQFDRYWLPILTLCLAGILMLTWATPDRWAGGFGNKNFIAEAVVLLVAFTVALSFTRMYGPFWQATSWLTALAGVVYLVGYNESNLQYLAIGAGVLWLSAVWVRKRAWRRVALIAALCLGAVVVFQMMGKWDAVEVSLIRRAEIWLNAGAMILDHPLFGVGLGSFDYAYPRTAHLAVMSGTFLENPTDFMGATHNEYLQVLVELGSVGVLLGGAIIWLALRGAWTPMRRAGAVCLVAAAAISLVGFPLQNPPGGVLVAIAAGLATRHLPTRRSVPALNFGGLAAVPLLAGAYYFAGGMWIAGQIPALMSVEPVLALAANEQAYVKWPFNPWIRLQGALSLRAVVVTHAGRVQLAPEAADRIYERAATAAPQHPGLLITRAEYLLTSGRWDDSDEIADILDTLHKVGSFYPQTWVLDAIYAASVGEDDRAFKAVKTALALPNGPRMLRQMGFLHEDKPS